MNDSKEYQDGYKAALDDVLDALGHYWCAMAGVGDDGESFKTAYQNLVADPHFDKHLTSEQINFFERL